MRRFQSSQPGVDKVPVPERVFGAVKVDGSSIPAYPLLRRAMILPVMVWTKIAMGVWTKLYRVQRAFVVLGRVEPRGKHCVFQVA